MISARIVAVCCIAFISATLQTDSSSSRLGRRWTTSDFANCPQCQPGSYAIKPCNDNITATVCRPCPHGTFSSRSTLATHCDTCSKCPTGWFEAEACRTSSDTVCQSCASEKGKDTASCRALDPDVAELYLMQGDDPSTDNTEDLPTSLDDKPAAEVTEEEEDADVKHENDATENAAVDDVKSNTSPDEVDAVLKEVTESPDSVDAVLKEVTESPDSVDAVLKEVTESPDSVDAGSSGDGEVGHEALGSADPGSPLSLPPKQSQPADKENDHGKANVHYFFGMETGSDGVQDHVNEKNDDNGEEGVAEDAADHHKAAADTEAAASEVKSGEVAVEATHEAETEEGATSEKGAEEGTLPEEKEAEDAAPEGDAHRGASEGEAQHVAPEGEAQHVAPEGEAEHVAPEGEAEHVAPEGDAEHVAHEGEAEHVAPEGEAEHVAPEGEAEHVAPEGDAEHVAPEGEAEHVAHEGEAEHVAPEGEAEHVAPEGEAEHVAPEGDAEHVAHEGEAEHVAPEGEAEHVAPEGEAEHVAPEGDAEHVAHEGEAEHVAHEGEAEQIAPEGEAEHVAPEGEAEHVAPEGDAEHVAPEGEAEHVAPEGDAEHVAHEGEAEHVAHEGEAEHVAPEGEAEHVAPEGEAEHVAPEGEAEHVAPEGEAEHVAPEGEAEHVAPEGEAEHVAPEGEAEHVAPEEAQHGAPEAEDEHGTPEGEDEHGTPEEEAELGASKEEVVEKADVEDKTTDKDDETESEENQEADEDTETEGEDEAKAEEQEAPAREAELEEKHEEQGAGFENLISVNHQRHADDTGDNEDSSTVPTTTVTELSPAEDANTELKSIADIPENVGENDLVHSDLSHGAPDDNSNVTLALLTSASPDVVIPVMDSEGDDAENDTVAESEDGMLVLAPSKEDGADTETKHATTLPEDRTTLAAPPPEDVPVEQDTTHVNESAVVHVDGETEDSVSETTTDAEQPVAESHGHPDHPVVHETEVSESTQLSKSSDITTSTVQTTDIDTVIPVILPPVHGNEDDKETSKQETETSHPPTQITDDESVETYSPSGLTTISDTNETAIHTHLIVPPLHVDEQKEKDKDDKTEPSTAATPSTSLETSTADKEVIDVEIPLEPPKEPSTTQRIPTLEEVESSQIPEETGSGDVTEIFHAEEEQTTESVTLTVSEEGGDGVNQSQAARIPPGHPGNNTRLGPGVKIVDDTLAPKKDSSKHVEDTEDDMDSKKRTAIIVGVTIGGLVVFAIGFFVSRNCRKRGGFRIMKKVPRDSGTTNGAPESVEFRPLPSGTGIYDEVDEVKGPSGRKDGYQRVQNPRYAEAAADLDNADIYAKVNKNKQPLASNEVHDGHVNGIDKIRFIDETTDDEAGEATLHDKLLPTNKYFAALPEVTEEDGNARFPTPQKPPAPSPSGGSQLSLSSDVIKNLDAKLTNGDESSDVYMEDEAPSSGRQTEKEISAQSADLSLTQS